MPLSAKQLTTHVTVQSDLTHIGTGRQQQLFLEWLNEADEAIFGCSM